MKTKALNLQLTPLDEGNPLPLDWQRIVIVGRHPAADWRLDSLRVSRRQAAMLLTDYPEAPQGWRLRDADNSPVGLQIVDLGSTNRTRRNGEASDKFFLDLGDELSIAHLRFRLEPCQSGPEGLLQTGVVHQLQPDDKSPLMEQVRRQLSDEIPPGALVRIIVSVEPEKKQQGGDDPALVTYPDQS